MLKNTYTAASALKQKGYDTAFFGKWHLGNLHTSPSPLYDKFDNTPMEYDFDYYLATTTNAASHDVTIHPSCRTADSSPEGLGHYNQYDGAYTHDVFDKGWKRWPQSVDSLVVERRPGDPFNDWYTGEKIFTQHTDPGICKYDFLKTANTSEDCDEIYERFATFDGDICINNGDSYIDPKARGNSAKYLVEKMFEWVDEDSNRGFETPFFMELCTWHMHTPFLGSSDINMNTENVETNDISTHGLYVNYRGALQELDDAIGVMINKLKYREIWNNTLVIFTADNGQERGMISGGSPGPYSGCKRETLEGGIRVPGLIQWPDVVTELYKSRMPANTYDFLPTVVDLLKDIPDITDKSTKFRYPDDSNNYGLDLWDGDSWLSLFEDASGTDHGTNWIDKDRDREMVIFGAYYSDDHSDYDEMSTYATVEAKKRWWWENAVIYDKSGRYKYYWYWDDLFDLQTNPRELRVDALDTYPAGPNKSIRDALRTSVEEKMVQVKYDRQNIDSNVLSLANEYSVCDAQKDPDDWTKCTPEYASPFCDEWTNHLDLQNINERCDNQGCPYGQACAFCGTDGKCCKKNEDGCTGKMGCTGFWCCTAP